jgi:hypothetical protein
MFGHELSHPWLFACCLWFMRLFLCASCWVLLLKWGLRYGNSPKAIHRHLSANSFRMYLIHPPVVALVQWTFLGWTSLDRLTTLAGTILLSLVASYLVTVFVGFVWQWAKERMMPHEAA